MDSQDSLVFRALTRWGVDIAGVFAVVNAMVLAAVPPTNAAQSHSALCVTAGVGAILALGIIVKAREESRARTVQERNDSERDVEARVLRETVQSLRTQLTRSHSLLESMATAPQFLPHTASLESTWVKVQALMLADHIGQFLAAEDVQKYDDAAAVSEYGDLFALPVRKTREDLADLGLNDGHLERFAYQQEGKDSIELTARAIERLANKLPEDSAFCKEQNNAAGTMSASQRWAAKIHELLADLRREVVESERKRVAERTGEI